MVTSGESGAIAKQNDRDWHDSTTSTIEQGATCFIRHEKIGWNLCNCMQAAWGLCSPRIQGHKQVQLGIKWLTNNDWAPMALAEVPSCNSLLQSWAPECGTPVWVHTVSWAAGRLAAAGSAAADLFEASGPDGNQLG